jgi:Fe2+ or Zn2+ uptake regulation protein
MDEAAKQRRIELFSARCRETGIPLTPQRRAVLEAVLALELHPTADQVHERVVAALPDVSRATVYRALETLVASGVITKLSHPGRAVRFDPRTERHHHLTCLGCDTVIDLDDERFDSLPIPDTSAFGFAVADFCVQLRGLCTACQAKEVPR